MRGKTKKAENFFISDYEAEVKRIVKEKNLMS